MSQIGHVVVTRAPFHCSCWHNLKRFGPTHPSALPSPDVPHHTQERNPKRLSHTAISHISRKRAFEAALISWASVYAHSCLILCDPMDCRSPGSSVHGILQAGILYSRNTGILKILQGIFLTQRSNPSLLCLPHWQVDSLPLSRLSGPIFII